MSLRWRLLGAFVLLIGFTILFSTTVEYWSEGRQLGEFSTKVRGDDLAGVLSRLYTTDGGWQNLEGVLVRTGFFVGPERIQDAEKAGYDLIERIAYGVIVRDAAGNVLIDTFSELGQNGMVAVIAGDATPIYELNTREVVGTVTINVSRDAVSAETRRFLLDSVFPTVMGGVITAILAVLLAFYLSRRITDPVMTLTRATQAITGSGNTQLLPVKSSDELGQMSASFNQMVTALATQRELRRRLINDVAHELNTPLSVIRLEAKGLKDGLKPPDAAADQIIDEVELLGNLIYDLDWLAETDSGNLRLEMAPHALDQLLAMEVGRWQLPAQAAHVELELLPLPPDLPPLQMDTVRISQALGNLIQNGLHYAPLGRFTPGGARVTVQCTLVDGWVQTAVCDTGSGIAAEDLPYVFERFYRTDRSRGRDTGGRGLGLSIVKQIVEAHGGEVWAESEPGRGSCFRFRLPALNRAGPTGSDQE